MIRSSLLVLALTVLSILNATGQTNSTLIKQDVVGNWLIKEIKVDGAIKSDYDPAIQDEIILREDGTQTTTDKAYEYESSGEWRFFDNKYIELTDSEEGEKQLFEIVALENSVMKVKINDDDMTIEMTLNKRPFSTQQALPTSKSINSHYHYLLTEEVSRFSVKIIVKEFKATLEPIVNQLYQNGDSLLARQLNELHTTLTYDKTSDSVNILVSPFDVDDSSALFEGSQNIKQGYHKMVSGAFMQFRSLLIDGLLSDNPKDNEINLESDKITVDFIDEGGQYRYTFSNDYKVVVMSGTLNDQNITGLIKARDIADKLVFDYQEFITPQIKIILNIFYTDEDKTILPTKIEIKNEINPMSAEYTLEFSDWKFE